jgi:hypothetical protein
MKGWIKIHRCLLENPIYNCEPFDRTHAWIDLLLLANHKEGYFYKRGIRVDVKEGQVGYDIDSLGKRWKWSRGKVERFLNSLENDKNIVRQKNNVTTLISIVKYKEYQANDNANEHQTIKQTNTNKNVKNEKNERSIFIEPTFNEILEYCTQRKNGVDVNKFLNFYSSKGWMVGKNKMIDWKACVRTWEKPIEIQEVNEPKKWKAPWS